VLDGHAATRRIRAELHMTELPIIALTADARSSERARSVAAGMSDFMVKPFGSHALLRGILRHVSPSVADRQTPHAIPTVVPTAGSLTAWDEIDGIDTVDARSRCGGDAVLFRSLLQRLLIEYADVGVSVAGGAMDDGALATFGQRMHKLRGAAGILGAKELERRAAAAEAACTAGSVADAASLAAVIGGLLARLRESAAPAVRPVHADATSRVNVTGLEPHLLIELIRLLRQQSLSALDGFNAMAPALQFGLGDEDFQIARDHMDNLRFGAAAAALERLR
jgi:CheY-like chemotaxis protein